MTSFEFLAEQLQVLVSSISGLTIKYEYDRNRQDHIIEVEPSEVYSSERAYAIAETELSLAFSKLFPLESIMFVSLDSLVRVEKPDKVFASPITNSVIWQPPIASFEQECENRNCEEDYFPEYSLAA